MNGLTQSERSRHVSEMMASRGWMPVDSKPGMYMPDPSVHGPNTPERWAVTESQIVDMLLDELVQLSRLHDTLVASLAKCQSENLKSRNAK